MFQNICSYFEALIIFFKGAFQFEFEFLKKVFRRNLAFSAVNNVFNDSKKKKRSKTFD